jgi:hypothetical protein
MEKNKFEFNEYRDICLLCNHDNERKMNIPLNCYVCNYIHKDCSGDELLNFLELYIFNKKNGKS